MVLRYRPHLYLKRAHFAANFAMSTPVLLDPALAWSGHLRRRLDAHPDLAAWLAEAVQQPLTPARIKAWQTELAGPDAPGTPRTHRAKIENVPKRVIGTTLLDPAGQAFPPRHITRRQPAASERPEAPTAAATVQLRWFAGIAPANPG